MSQRNNGIDELEFVYIFDQKWRSDTAEVCRVHKAITEPPHQTLKETLLCEGLQLQQTKDVACRVLVCLRETKSVDIL